MIEPISDLPQEIFLEDMSVETTEVPDTTNTIESDITIEDVLNGENVLGVEADFGEFGNASTNAEPSGNDFDNAG